jgi:hypothetical protein
MTKEAVVYLDKPDFITLMHKWGLAEDVPSIAALFGKSAQSVYKYLNVDSNVEIPLVVVRHIETLTMVNQRSVNALITKLLKTPLKPEQDIGVYFDYIDSFQYQPNNENVGIIFGKSTPTIYRATMTKKYDPAMAAHLRTFKAIDQKLVLESMQMAFEMAESEEEAEA